MTHRKIPIWLDCDPGHDDAFAILLSVLHPNSHLLGLSSVSGNASIDHTTHNALAILAALGHDNSTTSTTSFPVVRGASKPLIRPINFAPEIHGKTGLDGVPLLPSIPASTVEAVPEGVQHIADKILAQPKDEVWIIATGPLTTIALLFQQFPEVPGHIKGLSVMGGAIGDVSINPSSSSSSPSSTIITTPFSTAPPHRRDGKGNWTPHAEFNIWCDPEAASLVLTTLQTLRKPTILIPLDLTHQVRGTATVQTLLFPTPSKIRQTFKQILLYYASTYSEHSGIHDGPPLHDPLAVFAVLEPDAFDDCGGERWDISVDVGDGERAGETVATPRGDGRVGDVRIPRSVDLGRFWQAVDHALGVVEGDREYQVGS